MQVCVAPGPALAAACAVRGAGAHEFAAAERAHFEVAALAL